MFIELNTHGLCIHFPVPLTYSNSEVLKGMKGDELSWCLGCSSHLLSSSPLSMEL